MLVLSLLAVVSLSVSGSMDVSLDAAVNVVEEGVSELDISYEIPHSDLAFLKDSLGYTARFQIAVQLLDRQGNPLAGDVWQRAVRVDGYDLTVGRDTASTGSVSIRLEGDVVRARVEVRDLESTQTATASLTLDVPPDAVRIRFFKDGEILQTRVYGPRDTIRALATVVRAQPDADSLRFLVRQERRLVVASTRPLIDSGGIRRALFSFPVAESSGGSRLGSGYYDLEVVEVGGRAAVLGRLGFRIKLPFYFDDAAYQQKVDELLYIATAQEIRRLKAVPSAQREEAWHQFWTPKDPVPATDRNEKEEEYFERIDYSEEHFSHGDKGYRSDRARVYVRYGPPDNNEKKPFEVDQHAYEIWSYYGSGLEFVFVDRYGFGEYLLESPKFWHEG
jgi:GWxTD domain-containing protein